MRRRDLVWDGCLNVRDLGGLPTEDGGETAWGAVVRADNVWLLSDSGWRMLLDYGVRSVVDLRWHEELAEDAPAGVAIDVVHVSLFGDYDAGYGPDLDERLAHLEGEERVSAAYLEFLDRFRPNFGRAVAAVAEAREGTVLVHCQAGKDRTGLVTALLLRLAGVPVETVADDYAASAENLAEATVEWIAAAQDDVERRRRTNISQTPRGGMVRVLAELDARYGGVREYLLAAGATEEQLERARARVREGM